MRTIIILLGTAFFMLGCNQQPRVQQPVKTEKPKKQTNIPAPPPKKDIKLKEVEDENFSSDYMYPETNKKSAKKVEETPVVVDAAPESSMNNETCIAMIGQEKFDKYSEMFGNAGALKKCKMLKAL